MEGYDGHLEWESDANKVSVNLLDNSKNFELSYSCESVALHQRNTLHVKLLNIKESPEVAKEALLIAICIGSRPLVELILTLFRDFPHEERSGCSNAPGFLPHITPLMLACILNNFAIVQCLLLRGHSIDLPHHSTCRRLLLIGLTNRLGMQICVDAMRAVCSEAFLWLATDDPFAAACSLSQDIALCMDNDTFEFMVSDTYRALYNNLQRFTCRVIENNWRMEELDIFLAHKCHCPLSSCSSPYPRIQMALEARMRSFAGNPNVQQAMSCIWFRGWGNFGSNAARDSYRVLRHVILYPVLAVLYIATNGRVLNFMLLLYSVLASGIAIEAYCYLYIVGIIVERYIQFSRYGFQASCTVTSLQPSWDYFLIYDIYLCTGCILGLSRVFYFIQLIKGVGGSVISVGRCVSTIYNYLIVMVVIMLSFAVGVNLLVTPYLNSVMALNNGWDLHSSVFITIRNKFWALFGYLDPGLYPIINGNSGPDQAPVKHKITSFALELLLALYHGIIVITILNLMVSLLVKKADEVLENEESEFKYTRVAIYSEYIAWSSAVPPPFNLLYIVKEMLQKLICDARGESCKPALFDQNASHRENNEIFRRISRRVNALRYRILLTQRYLVQKKLAENTA
ncbi:unnamed protein product [Heligmosomoides polygyrus]|uniref:Ion_trans domain-containing protein n=1 Tax=Heligmosomoides polygyrus TaxID=6339 RepID=A0A3P7WG79_HELPZ|nr:unnamed protein product [Heligmosomoides polygyrus]